MRDSMHVMTAALLLVLALAMPARAGGGDVAVSSLVGTAVTAPGGERLGEIAGVLIDVRPGGIHYAILAVEHAGGRQERFAYPVNAFRQAGDGGLALNVPRERLRALPGFATRDWPAPEFRSETRYVEAARLFGRTVEDGIGNRVGVLRDAVVNLHSGTTRTLLVAFEGQATPTPLPAHLIRLQVDGNAVLQSGRARRA
jgi:sporulation protein YlmC with PRC-barrel domain